MVINNWKREDLEYFNISQGSGLLRVVYLLTFNTETMSSELPSISAQNAACLAFAKYILTED